MGREFWVWQFPSGDMSQTFSSRKDCWEVCNGLAGQPAQLVPAGDIQQYLKEGETVADCIERNRRDADAAVELLRKAREKLEEAQKDAARYRWLRDMTPWTAVGAFDKTRIAFRLAAKIPETAAEAAEDLDNAIDAAIAAQEQSA